MDYAIGQIPITQREADFLDEWLQAWAHMKEAITFHEKIKEVKSYRKNRKYTTDSLLMNICEITGFTPAQIYSRAKKDNIADVRVCISMIAHELHPELSNAQLGRIINKDHSTIYHHYEILRDTREVKELYLTLKCKLGLL